MATRGLEGLVFETHNWGKSVAFWQALGYELEFETDHHSGQLRHPAGGPYIFLAERPEGDARRIEAERALLAMGNPAPDNCDLRCCTMQERLGEFRGDEFRRQG